MKNYLKKILAWLPQSQHRTLQGLSQNVSLRLFLIFLLGIFAAHLFVDFLAHWRLAETLGGYVWGPAPLFGLSKISLIFGNLGDAPLFLQVIAIMLVAALAVFFTDIAMAPVTHARNDQKRFVANASHELRTPLSIMKTTAEVVHMRGDKVTKEEMVEFTDGIIEEVNRMSSIIEFFLRFATMENKQHVQMSDVSVAQVTDKVVGILGRVAEEKGVELAFKERALASVRGNFTALEEMFINLVKNAITHTPKGGRVTLSVREQEDGVLAVVSDTGDGISHEDLPYIFEPFFRGTNEARRKGGIGLGLTIVREIAKMHGAKVAVESHTGKGTTFAVKFPKH